MANIEAQIKPGGLNQRSIVNLLYQVVASIKGICAKLDDDAGVTSTTYEANVYTALFNGEITDGRGNTLRNVPTASTANFDRYVSISPAGLTPAALTELLYQIFDMLETLTEQLDGDGTVTDTTYEANCYTAKILWIIENVKGSVLGNGTTFYIRPGSIPESILLEVLYNLVDAIETLTEQLDADTGVTDTNYEALWFTATILMRVQNSKGNVVGNDITTTP
jgi:hypothetical protein